MSAHAASPSTTHSTPGQIMIESVSCWAILWTFGLISIPLHSMPSLSYHGTRFLNRRGSREEPSDSRAWEIRNGAQERGEIVPHGRAGIFLTASFPPLRSRKSSRGYRTRYSRPPEITQPSPSPFGPPSLFPLLPCARINPRLASKASGAFFPRYAYPCEDSVFFRLNEEERLRKLAESFPEIRAGGWLHAHFPGIFLGQGEPGRPAGMIVECPSIEGGISWRGIRARRPRNKSMTSEDGGRPFPGKPRSRPIVPGPGRPSPEVSPSPFSPTL